MIAILLSVGVFFLLPKEEAAVEKNSEVKDEQKNSSKRKVPLSELPGSRGSYKIDIQQAEDLRFYISAEIKVVNESKSVWEDIGFYFIPNAMTKENIDYSLQYAGRGRDFFYHRRSRERA